MNINLSRYINSKDHATMSTNLQLFVSYINEYFSRLTSGTTQYVTKTASTALTPGLMYCPSVALCLNENQNELDRVKSVATNKLNETAPSLFKLLESVLINDHRLKRNQLTLDCAINILISLYKFSSYKPSTVDAFIPYLEEIIKDQIQYTLNANRERTKRNVTSLDSLFERNIYVDNNTRFNRFDCKGKPLARFKRKIRNKKCSRK